LTYKTRLRSVTFSHLSLSLSLSVSVSLSHLDQLLKDLDSKIPALKENIHGPEFSQIQDQQTELWRLTNEMKCSLKSTPTHSENKDNLNIPLPKLKVDRAQPVKPVVEVDRDQDVTSASTITNLLLKQKDISVKELEDERIAQRDIVNELTELTALLKENTLAMSQSVQQQNMVRRIFLPLPKYLHQ
jgi:hypothetical protein